MRKIFIVLGFILIFLLSFLIPSAHAEAPDDPLPLKPVPYVTKHFAEQYGVSYSTLMKVMECESSFNQKAVGDGGKAIGIAQYHRGTFEAFSKELGENLDINSSFDQIKLTAFAFSKGYQSHWTCFKKVTE